MECTRGSLVLVGKAESYRQPRTGWRICGGGRQRAAPVVVPRCQRCLNPGTRWRTLQVVVRAKTWFSTCSTPDFAARMPAKPIVAVRCSGTSLPQRASLHAICEAGLVPFSTFHQYLHSRCVMCALLSVIYNQLARHDFSLRRQSTPLTCVSSTHMNRMLVRMASQS